MQDVDSQEHYKHKKILVTKGDLSSHAFHLCRTRLKDDQCRRVNLSISQMLARNIHVNFRQFITHIIIKSRNLKNTFLDVTDFNKMFLSNEKYTKSKKLKNSKK